jgi:hypothetical protein
LLNHIVLLIAIPNWLDSYPTIELDSYPHGLYVHYGFVHRKRLPLEEMPLLLRNVLMTVPEFFHAVVDALSRRVVQGPPSPPLPRLSRNA